MQQMTASRAKQNFGDLLDAIAKGPVAIERHGRLRAIVCTPESFQDQGGSQPERVLAERRAARAAQELVEKDRLIRHQKLALELVLMPTTQREASIARARAEVARWRRERLCSEDYAQRWEALLALPLADLARALGDDALEEGRALRQNSPWIAAPA
jgi:PHD/YefM family antitoxin component YafN of YafNO toxin-antitoxin module